VAVGLRAVSDVCGEGDGVVLVGHTGVQVQLHWHSCAAERQRVGDVLVTEDVQPAHLDVGRWKSGRVGEPCGDSTAARLSLDGSRYQRAQDRAVCGNDLAVGDLDLAGDRLSEIVRLLQHRVQRDTSILDVADRGRGGIGPFSAARAASTAPSWGSICNVMTVPLRAEGSVRCGIAVPVPRPWR
jgi:hypothetical protein